MLSLPPKLSAFISALDALEHRKSVAYHCGWIALALLAASFVPDLVLVMDFSWPYQVAQFSQDEFWFMKEILKLQHALVGLDITAIRQYGSPFAYGFPFWLIAALLGMPFYTHAMPMVLFLRVAFMAMKYAAFYVIYRRMLALTQKPLASLLTLCVLLAIPAFVFDGKIIGPEYLIMLLIALSWSALFSPRSGVQVLAAFCFTFAAAVKINTAPLGLVFLAVLFAHPPGARRRLLLCWIAGALLPVLLFFVPAHPFTEILVLNKTHRINYSIGYLPLWYVYDTIEFDGVLRGGWRADFMAWPFFLVMLGYALYRAARLRAAKPVAARARGGLPATMPMAVAAFFTAALVCVATGFSSLLHPWFLFVPFLLLVAAGCLMMSVSREGTAVMLVFFLVYAAWYGNRYALHWEHRADKFDYIASTEPADADVASWIAEHCPKAREAIIDYNLLWPPSYNGKLHRMWTLIEVEDDRRAKGGDAGELFGNVDLLLIKSERIHALEDAGGPQIRVPGAAIANFLPNSPPLFTRQKDFPQLSVFARDGVCKK